MPLQTGHLLNNRYRIVKLLGEGGFGAVYRAWDVNLKGPCALKENLETAASSQKQFFNEASILFNLRHPNLPRVFDAFSIPDQGQYLVMDFVEGQDLQKVLDEHGGPFAESDVLPWIQQVGEALIYLHSQEQPVIHRDIKPANIRITPNGQAILVDFGIAKLYDPLQSTTHGAKAITSGYSPPEQYGQARTDARSDVYALGATTYALLAGHPPPDSVDLMTRVQPIPASLAEVNPKVSAATSEAVAKCMQLDRDQRFSSVAEFLDALKFDTFQVVDSHKVDPAQYQPAMPAQVAPQSQTRSRRWLWLGAALILVVALASLIYALSSSSKSNLPVEVMDQRAVPMRLVEAGDFLMGSETGNQDESPRHKIYLDAYYMDKFEVTNKNYADCVNAGACEPPDCNIYYNLAFQDHPVVCVDWEQAVAYCAWRGGRLPTEAEWEKAARGDLDAQPYPWGNEDPVCSPSLENGAQYRVCSGETQEVGSYAPNPFGLYDMAGNVWEWVYDWYSPKYYQTSGSENPAGPESGIYHVLRGGSWNSDRDGLHVSKRFNRQGAERLQDTGFRCVAKP